MLMAPCNALATSNVSDFHCRERTTIFIPKPAFLAKAKNCGKHDCLRRQNRRSIIKSKPQACGRKHMSDLITPDELRAWVPGELTVDSARLGWEGVRICGYRYAPLDVPIPG